MWWLLGAAGLVILAKILADWGWNRGWGKSDIAQLPMSPGVYILHFPRHPNRVYIGSTNQLRRRLQEQKNEKRGWTEFDWYQTRTTRDARSLEKKLQNEVNRRM